MSPFPPTMSAGASSLFDTPARGAFCTWTLAEGGLISPPLEPPGATLRQPTRSVSAQWTSPPPTPTLSREVLLILWRPSVQMDQGMCFLTPMARPLLPGIIRPVAAPSARNLTSQPQMAFQPACPCFNPFMALRLPHHMRPPSRHCSPWTSWQQGWIGIRVSALYRRTGPCKPPLQMPCSSHREPASPPAVGPAVPSAWLPGAFH